MSGRLIASVIPEAHLEQCHSEALAGGYLAAWRASLQRAAHINARQRSHSGFLLAAGRRVGMGQVCRNAGGWFATTQKPKPTKHASKQSTIQTKPSANKQTIRRSIRKSMTRQPSMETINATCAFCESQVGRTSGRMKTSPDV